MPGFFVSNNSVEFQLRNQYPERCLAEKLNVPNVTFKRNTLKKFMQDKAFMDIGNLLVVLDGYLLNKKELLCLYRAKTVEELIQTMYQQNGEQFFSEFRGVFSGAVYDKKQDKWLIFTNHTGYKAVFYTVNASGFAAGSQVNYVLDACKAMGRPLTFDEQAAYQMLTFGFMEGNSTYAKEIKRLRGGTYLRICNGIAEVCEYHQFRKNPEHFADKTEEQIIDILDEQFRRAVELALRKDVEYGKKHLVDISGGLDTRMSVWAAHGLNAGTLQLLNYGKANYLDELIAKQIATHFKDELLIKPIDDAGFLYDIDELIFMSGGLSLYSGITGGKRMLESINMDNYGLEHTGLLYGGMIGSYIDSQDGLEKKEPTGRYSEVLSHRLTEEDNNIFQDHEMYILYSRGFRGIQNTIQIRDNFTETATPSLQVDFIQTCIDIPLEMRMNHKLYKKWIMKKYPTAADFKWEKIDGKITDPKWLSLLRRIVKRGPDKLLRVLKLRKDTANGMNPIGYWINRDEDLRSYLDTYEKEGYTYLPAEASAQLIDDMKRLYATGTAMEKTMVLTVLGAAKLYFG